MDSRVWTVIFGGSVGLAGSMSSLLADLVVRAAPKSSIPRSVVERLPAIPESAWLTAQVVGRYTRLNALTHAYADYVGVRLGRLPEMKWTGGGLDYPGREPLEVRHPQWTPSVPLRRAADRRQALVEIDAIVALRLGIYR